MSTTISLVLTTIVGYLDDGRLSFYSECARAIHGCLRVPIHYTTDDHYLGSSIIFDSSDIDIITACAVKKGYKLKIIKGKRI